MLAHVITWSLRHRALVIGAWLAIAIGGVLALAQLPLDAFPDTTPVQVQINTSAAALAPREVERQLTQPVEQAVSGLPGLIEVRSLSRFGLSQVTATFEDGTDVYRARQLVGERLRGVRLPVTATPPELGPVATGLGEVFHYVVEGAPLPALREVQDWQIRPQLAALPGVAEVNAWGGQERQLHVVVDPGALRRRDLTLDQVLAALADANLSAAGGVLEGGGEAAPVTGLALVTSKAELEAAVITATDGVPVRVADVARVVDGVEIRRGAVTADGRGEVVLGLGFMLIGENSADVTHRLALRLAEIQKTLPPGVTATPVYQRTTLVDEVLGTVRRNLLEGALLVIAVLFVFLGSLRAGLIVALAIPLSMLVAGAGMLKLGVAGTLMSLGAVDFGLIVDSSVIVVENSARRLAEDDPTRTRLEVVRDAVLEVRRPTMFGELIILVVYLPVLLLEGTAGQMFRPMAMTVMLALGGSMLLSLTLVPVLASLLLRRGGGPTAHREPWLVRQLQRGYRRALAAVLRAPLVALGAALLVVGNAALAATTLGAEFQPRLSEGTIAINTVRLASVSLDESVRVGTQVERALLADFPDEITRVWSRTGTAEVATDPMGLEVTDIFVQLAPRARWRRARTQAELVTAMQATLGDLPGMRAVFTQPIEMRLAEMTAGIRADVGVKLFGDDLEVLRAKAAEIQRLVAAVPGAVDVTTEQLTGAPVLEIQVDRKAISRFGIRARDVLAVVAALGGEPVGELTEGERRFPIVMRLPDDARRDRATIGALLVTAASGERIPLGRLASIDLVEGPAAVQREWGKRRIVVQANVAGRDVASFVAEVQGVLGGQLDLPTGYYVRYGGQFEHLQAASRRLLIVVPLALALIIVLLHATYGRWRDTARVFLGVPLAAAGGVLALWLRDLPFSIPAGVGFVALAGIAVLGDMVLVSTVRQLEAAGLPPREAITLAAERRLRPVLMTALVAALGLVPMALSAGVGAEVQRPLATVIIGGVITSTLLTLFVLPVLYAGRRGPAGAPAEVAP